MAYENDLLGHAETPMKCARKGGRKPDAIIGSPDWERSHRGLVRRFAKPLSGVSCSEGSNPSLSASFHQVESPATRAPVAQWIERQVADLKVVSSSLAGRANPSHRPGYVHTNCDVQRGGG